MVYFIAFIRTLRDRDSGPYMEYIRDVRPIVEGFGGRYIVRSDKVSQPGVDDEISDEWRPNRVIIIEWDSKEQMEKCFSSDEYRRIAGKREETVDGRAIIVEG